MSFKKNILKNKQTSSEFKNNSFKNKNNDNGDSDKYVSGAKGYNPEESYFKSLQKSVQENPMSDVPYSKKGPYDRRTIKEVTSSKSNIKLHQRAKQIQIKDYRKKSLTLKKK